MHISEVLLNANIPLTKCSKMTEEGQHRRHGMNGNADGNLKEECPKSNYLQGGRLKFFKDGKFILELERAREGERVSWVSVPRKTFWPPQGTAASTPTYRQESSTSLSVSDDNSSIQSSPWQRDHSWKQTTPRRSLSKEMSMYFWRPKNVKLFRRSNKRRRPYSTEPEVADQKVLCKERTSMNNTCNNKVKLDRKSREKLLNIVQNLIEKVSRTSTPPRAEMVVSPRKRFLREMEKDKAQVEDNCLKRSRNKQGAQGVGASTAVSKVGSPVQVNGTSEEPKPQKNCSYSITSLLAEDRNSKRSPSNSPSHFSPVTQAQYCSPTSDDRLYSENMDKLRLIEVSQVEKRGFSPYHSPQPYLHSYMYNPYTVPPPLYNVCGRGAYVVPPLFHTPPMHFSLRYEAPSSSRSSEPIRENENKEESLADMPLNLSKHAG